MKTVFILQIPIKILLIKAMSLTSVLRFSLFAVLIFIYIQKVLNNKKMLTLQNEKQ